jgi:hypothetical protein
VPRDIDTLGRVDGEIEKVQPHGKSHGTRNARASLAKLKKD